MEYTLFRHVLKFEVACLMQYFFIRAILNTTLCHHRNPRCSTQGPGGVLDGGPLGLSTGGTDGGSAKRTEAGGGDTDGCTGSSPGPTHTLTAMRDKDRGLDESVAVHSQ